LHAEPEGLAPLGKPNPGTRRVRVSPLQGD